MHAGGTVQSGGGPTLVQTLPVGRSTLVARTGRDAWPVVTPHVARRPPVALAHTTPRPAVVRTRHTDHGNKPSRSTRMHRSSLACPPCTQLICSYPAGRQEPRRDVVPRPRARPATGKTTVPRRLRPPRRTTPLPAGRPGSPWDLDRSLPGRVHMQ